MYVCVNIQNFLFLHTFIFIYIGINFSAWGDGVFLGLQTLIIAILVMHYNGDTAKAITFLSTYIAVISIANSRFTPISVLWACQAMNIPIVLMSKVRNHIIITITTFENLLILSHWINILQIY